MPNILFGTLHGDALPVICAKYCWFSSGWKYLKYIFLLWAWKINSLSEFMTLSTLICWWLNSKCYFSSRFGRLSALEQTLWAFECCNTREKSWPLMTSKSDPGGYSGVKCCAPASFMRRYRYTNFHQNWRFGPVQRYSTWNWNDPKTTLQAREERRGRTRNKSISIFPMLFLDEVLRWDSQIPNWLLYVIIQKAATHLPPSVLNA